MRKSREVSLHTLDPTGYRPAEKMNADHEFQRIRLRASFAFAIVRFDQRFQILPRNDAKVSRNFVLLAPPSCGEVSANKSANEGALIVRVF